MEKYFSYAIKHKNVRKLLTVLVISLSYPVYTEVSNWLWKIGDKEYTVDSFTRDYNAFIDLMAWQMGTSKSVLKSYIGKEGSVEDERLKALITQLSPGKFSENQLLLALLYKNAQDSGYLDKPENKIKSEFIHQYIMSQMYLSDVMEKIPVEIKDEELEQAWVEERNNNPNLKSVPIDQGLIFMRQKLTRDKKEKLKSEFIKGLNERYSLKKNKDLDSMVSKIVP